MSACLGQGECTSLGQRYDKGFGGEEEGGRDLTNTIQILVFIFLNLC